MISICDYVALVNAILMPAVTILCLSQLNMKIGFDILDLILIFEWKLTDFLIVLVL